MAMRIKTLRESANLTQVQLADKLGVLPTTVSNWETGVALPKTTILPQLAETLGCSIDELYERDSPRQASLSTDQSSA